MKNVGNPLVVQWLSLHIFNTVGVGWSLVKEPAPTWKCKTLVTQSCLTPWTVAGQGPLSIGFSSQEYWSGLPFPSLGDLPHPGIKPRSSASQADSWPSEPSGKPHPYYNQYTLQVTRLRNEGLFSPRGDDFPRIVCPGGLGSSVCQYTHIVLWLQKLMVWMKAQPFDNWCLHKAPLYMWVAGCWVKQTTETVLETGILSAA